MKALKTKSLYAAVIAGLGAAGSMQAGAVNISQDNTGQVLIYPYYTVRNGFVTSLSIVNTDQDHTKVVKVRFLEGKNSAEVLDFNLFLSPRDVWTAAVIDNGTGGAVYTTDKSCTAPLLPSTPDTAKAFLNAYYTGGVGGGVFNDNGGTSLDRTREGYVEFIEMGVVGDTSDAAATPGTTRGNSVAAAVKHGTTGVPSNCNVVRAINLFPGANDLRQPVGGLVGSGIIVNVASGVEFAYSPVALANFFVDGLNNGASDLYSESGSLNPDLRNVLPARSDVFVDGAAGAPSVISEFGAGDLWTDVVGGVPVDAVSAVLMRSAIINEYDVSPGFKTDWVITAPTKRWYVLPADAAAALADPVDLAVGPFNTTFASATVGGAQSCDIVYPAAYDREEAPYGVSQGVVFSPVPAGANPETGQLCYETTVVTILPSGGTLATGQVFGSANSASLKLPAGNNYGAGWIALHPTRDGGPGVPSANGPGQFVTAGTNGTTGVPVALITPEMMGGLRDAVGPLSGFRYRGLPVIGFAAIQTVANVGAAGVQGFGGIFEHKYSRSISVN